MVCNLMFYILLLVAVYYKAHTTSLTMPASTSTTGTNNDSRVQMMTTSFGSQVNFYYVIYLNVFFIF